MGRLGISPEALASLQKRAAQAELHLGLLICACDTQALMGVVACVQCPPVQEGQEALTLQSRKPGLSLDQHWLLEHAGQVADLCPGGLCVGGLYLVCAAGALAASPRPVCQALVALKPLVRQRAGEGAHPLLLQLETPGTKAAAHILQSSKALGELDLRPDPTLANPVQLTCRYQVDAVLHVTSASLAGPAALQQLAAQESRRIAAGACCMGGQPASSAATVASLASGQILDVKLLTPPSSACCPEEQTEPQPLLGILHLRGCVCGLAYAAPSTSFGAASQLLKDDLARNLQARFDALVADAEEGQHAGLLQQLSASSGLTADLPLRVPILLQGRICLTDLVNKGAGESGLLAAANDLLMLRLASSKQVEQLEVSSAGPVAAAPRAGAASGLGHVALLAAAVITLLSVLLLFLLQRRQQ